MTAAPRDGFALQHMTTLVPTPNDCPLPRRRADFATFVEAIDYAAQSDKGLNFHDMRGELAEVYPYARMREDALAVARRLLAQGIGKGDRVALIADTAAPFAAPPHHLRRAGELYRAAGRAARQRGSRDPPLSP
jgi:hypothetical protein